MKCVELIYVLEYRKEKVTQKKISQVKDFKTINNYVRKPQKINYK